MASGERGGGFERVWGTIKELLNATTVPAIAFAVSLVGIMASDTLDWLRNVPPPSEWTSDDYSNFIFVFLLILISLSSLLMIYTSFPAYRRRRHVIIYIRNLMLNQGKDIEEGWKSISSSLLESIPDGLHDDMWRNLISNNDKRQKESYEIFTRQIQRVPYLVSRRQYRSIIQDVRFVVLMQTSLMDIGVLLTDEVRKGGLSHPDPKEIMLLISEEINKLSTLTEKLVRATEYNLDWG